MKAGAIHSPMRWLLALLAALPVDGAGGVSIFELGTLIDQKQWTVMLMYFGVFFITIVLELVVHTAHHRVSTSSGKAVMHHVTQEVMILGGIAAVLIVFENLGGGALIDAALFHYVHFVVFLMAMLFITMVSSLFILVDSSWRKWAAFENGLKSLENDPSLTMESRAAFVEKYIKSTHNGDKMAAAIIFFESNIPSRFRGVSFSRYMGKMQRKIMLHFLHLDIAAWTLLSVLLLLAAVVTGVTNEISSNSLATIGLWVLIIGYGSLFVLIIVFFKIKKEFKLFAIEVQELKQDGLKRPKRKMKSYFWESPHMMERIMQTALVYQVFFLATTIVNFIYRLYTSGPLGWMLILGCVGPAVLVFFIMIPIIMPPFTVLASLGEFLDHDTLIMIISNDKNSGKYRRQWRREGEMTALAPFAAEDIGVLTREKNVEPMVFDEENVAPGCDECGMGQAATFCEWCGHLCGECDTDYHRLRHNRHHIRTPIGEQEEAIRRTAPSKIFELLKKQQQQHANPLAAAYPTSNRGSGSADSSVGHLGGEADSQIEYQPLLVNEGGEGEEDGKRKKHHRKDKDRDRDRDKRHHHRRKH